MCSLYFSSYLNNCYELLIQIQVQQAMIEQVYRKLIKRHVRYKLGCSDI